MITTEKLETLHTLLDGSSPEELIWINGYLAGVMAKEKINLNKHEPPRNDLHVNTKKLSLVYGSSTGNSKRMASQLATKGKKHGLNIRLHALDQYKFEDLLKEEYFFIVISTQGEGEPPENAKAFYDYLQHTDIDLSHLKYSVLALGDSSYPLFCQTGIEVDSRLHALGAHRIVDLQKCDVDFEEDGQAWFKHILAQVESNPSVQNSAKLSEVKPKNKGKIFYNGTIRKNINLNDRGSNKETFHIEIGADGSIDYAPGDALGIIPSNKKVMVDLILTLTGVEKDQNIETEKDNTTIEEILTHHVNICFLHPTAIKKFADLTGQTIPFDRVDLVDLLFHYPVKDTNQFIDFIKVLPPITPRLYSISSSPLAHGTEEIHITVSRHSFRVNQEQRYGLCSDFLGELPLGTNVKFYIHKNHEFKLPTDNEKDVIMIGPGTGVAPFRSFLAERDATGAQGKNWLFFGDQHFTSDFLYQTEMQSLVETGVLSQLSLAFSRDQPEKIYVQDRMLQQGKELFQWLEGGASVYVCGSKDPNSISIEQALLNIIEENGNLSSDDASSYLNRLVEETRYIKDVY